MKIENLKIQTSFMLNKIVLGILLTSLILESPLFSDEIKLPYSPAPVDNPLKGLVPYARPTPGRFPHSMEFNYLPSRFANQPSSMLPSGCLALGTGEVTGREVDKTKVNETLEESLNVTCEGVYPRHLQGIAKDEDSIYWSFTTEFVKTDLQGKVLKKIPVANHHGDLCYSEGKLFIAVNLGNFNDPQGNADSWVYVYDAVTLQELARHEVQEVFHGAGGIGVRSGHFFVVGGLPASIDENYVYEYDSEFKFVKRHVISSGQTHLGIQSATFAHDRWWLGCYGSPKILLVTDAEFQMQGRYEFDCSLGIEKLPNGKLLAASGPCTKDKGCTGKVRTVVPNEKSGLKYVSKK